MAYNQYKQKKRTQNSLLVGSLLDGPQNEYGMKAAASSTLD